MKKASALSLLWALCVAMAQGIGLLGSQRSVAKTQIAQATLPEQFTIETLAAGLALPTALAFAPDGRIFIAEQQGVVKVHARGNLQLTPVIDLRDEVNALLERGLTGIAVDADFASNGFLYLLYSYDAPGEARDEAGARKGKLVRLVVRGDVADGASAVTLLDGFESISPYHATGSVRVANDATLFVSFGDGGLPDPDANALAAQDLDKLNGKILRIDRAGKALASNPFFTAQQPDGVRAKVWAYGFRHPFRFGLHPATQVPYVGSVGWNTTESLVRVPAGSNFGWPCYESQQVVPALASTAVCAQLGRAALVQPEFDYPHAGENAAIIGGAFNTQSRFPPEMRYNFFFGDFSKRQIWRGVLDEQGKVTKIEDFARGVGYLVDIQFGPDGALYFINIYNGGLLSRIDFDRANHPPVARLAVVQGARTVLDGRLVGALPITVTFSAAASTDPDEADAGGNALSYAWRIFAPFAMEWPPIETTVQPTITRTFTKPGEYAIELTVIDRKGLRSSVEQVLLVRGTQPWLGVDGAASGDTWHAGERVVLHAFERDANGAALAASANLKWRWKAELRAGVGVGAGTPARWVVQGTGQDIVFVMPAAPPEVLPQRMQESAFVLLTVWGADAARGEGVEQVRLYPHPRDGYVRSWWLMGGFPQSKLSDDVLLGGEAQVLDAAALVRNRARLIQSYSRKVNLASYIWPAEETVAYAFVWVASPTAREGLLGMNSDDGIAVWLNGSEVWRNNTDRIMPDDTRDFDLPRIKLKQGVNALLVKVDQGSGEWAFKLRVLDSNGSVMRDIRFEH